MSVTCVMRALIGTGGTQGELAESEAHELVAAMLDGGVAELELGAVLALLEQKRRTLAELLGCSSALAQLFSAEAPRGDGAFGGVRELSRRARSAKSAAPAGARSASPRSLSDLGLTNS
jgi:hypothetical protein